MSIKEFAATSTDRAPQSTTSEQKNNDYASVLKLATMEEPRADETIVNVDRNDDEIEDQRGDEIEISEPESRRPSFFARLNPFKSRSRYEEEEGDENDEPDPFFQALHNSFNGGRMEPSPFAAQETSFGAEPSFGTVNELPQPQEQPVEPVVSAQSFGNLQSTLETLRAQNENIPPAAAVNEVYTASAAAPEITVEPVAVSQPQAAKREEKDEDLVYPFGGWTDENNYNG